MIRLPYDDRRCTLARHLRIRCGSFIDYLKTITTLPPATGTVSVRSTRAAEARPTAGCPAGIVSFTSAGLQPLPPTPLLNRYTG
jgi:hypothetical protein